MQRHGVAKAAQAQPTPARRPAAPHQSSVPTAAVTADSCAAMRASPRSDTLAWPWLRPGRDGDTSEARDLARRTAACSPDRSPPLTPTAAHPPSGFPRAAGRRSPTGRAGCCRSLGPGGSGGGRAGRPARVPRPPQPAQGHTPPGTLWVEPPGVRVRWPAARLLATRQRQARSQRQRGCPPTLPAHLLAPLVPVDPACRQVGTERATLAQLQHQQRELSRQAGAQEGHCSGWGGDGVG